MPPVTGRFLPASSGSNPTSPAFLDPGANRIRRTGSGLPTLSQGAGDLKTERSAVLEGLMGQECQTAKLSSIANLTTFSLVWREPLKSHPVPPVGDIGGSFLSLSLSLSA
jgi:hypothetical protein